MGRHVQKMPKNTENREWEWHGLRYCVMSLLELELELVPYSEAKPVLEKVGFQRRP